MTIWTFKNWGANLGRQGLASAIVGAGVVGSAQTSESGDDPNALKAILARGVDRLFELRFDAQPNAPARGFERAWTSGINEQKRAFPRERVAPRVAIPANAETALGTKPLDEFYRAISQDKTVGGVIIDPDPRPYAERVVWDWPVDVGVFSESMSKVLSNAADHHTWVKQLALTRPIGHFSSRPNILFLSWVEALLLARRSNVDLGADFLVCYGKSISPTHALRGPYADLLHASGAAGLAVVGAEVNLGNLYREFVRHLSHDAPVASAMKYASNGRAVMLGDGAALERCRITNVAERVTAYMNARANISARRMAPPGVPEATDATKVILRLDAMAAVHKLSFSSEEDGRMAATNIMDGVRSLEAQPPARWLQTAAFRPGVKKGYYVASNWLTPNEVTLIGVHIGKPGAGTRANKPFPEDIDFVKGRARLSVSLKHLPTENQERAGIRAVVSYAKSPPKSVQNVRFATGRKFGEIADGIVELPQLGDSSVVLFAVKCHAAMPHKFEITLQSKGRILQVAELQIDVKASRGTPRPKPPKLIIVAVPHRRTDDVERRSEFQVGINAIRDNTGLSATFWRMTEAGGDAIARHVYLNDLDSPIGDLRTALHAITSSHSKSTATRTTQQGLFDLASNGRLLFDSLRKSLADALDAALDSTAVNAVLNATRMQIVAKSSLFLPLELVYSGAAPSESAKVCATWMNSAIGAACSCGAKTSKNTICPSLFWGLNKVIEREGRLTRAQIAVGRSPAREPFPKLGAALIAMSGRTRIDENGDKQRASLQAKLRDLTGAASQPVENWLKWQSEIGRTNPQLLVLVPHIDKVRGVDKLEIGGTAPLTKAQIDKTYVGKEDDAQLLLFLGCSGADVQDRFYPFPERFRDAGADIVVAPLAPIVAPQALTVAEKFLAALHTTENGAVTTLGELLTSIRRQLLTEGVPAGMGIVGFGDTDWRFGGEA